MYVTENGKAIKNGQLRETDNRDTVQRQTKQKTKQNKKTTTTTTTKNGNTEN